MPPFAGWVKRIIITCTAIFLLELVARRVFHIDLGGVEGLIHISQLSSQRVRTVADVVKVGDVIQLRVLSVDPAQHRISLSLKAAKEEEVPAAAAATAEPVAAKPEKKRKRELRGGLSY